MFKMTHLYSFYNIIFSGSAHKAGGPVFGADSHNLYYNRFSFGWQDVFLFRGILVTFLPSNGFLSLLHSEPAHLNF